MLVCGVVVLTLELFHAESAYAGRKPVLSHGYDSFPRMPRELCPALAGT